MIEDLVPLINEELNVKEVTFIKELSQYMNFSVKPNFKEVGKLLGSKIKEFQEKLQKLSSSEINNLRDNKDIEITLAGDKFKVTSSMVIINSISKEGFDVALEDNDFIILNTDLTEDLIMEGIAREFISKIQNLRKQKEFDIIDRINIYYDGDKEVENSVDKFKELIKNETLAIEIKKGKSSNEVDLNGHNATIDVEVIKK